MLKENDIISKVLLSIKQCKGNLATFKTSITDNEYTPSGCSHFTRTLVWKVCLMTHTLKIQGWESKLTDSRVVYHELVKREDLAIPWWKLDVDSEFYLTKETSKHKTRIGRQRTMRIKQNLIRVGNVDDPLRSPGISPSRKPQPYVTTEDDLELLQTIILDIDRLFPGDSFFLATNPNSFASKKQMIEILFVWSKCNPQVGYKQGIHEILGLLYLNMHTESIEIPTTNTFSGDDLRILNLYDIKYIAHDLFTLFNQFMVQSGIIARFYEDEKVLWKNIESFNAYLMKVDQLIHYNLISKLKLESQIWIIRYLRLMLSRELGNDLSAVSLLWDKLVATQLSGKASALLAISDLIIFMTIQLLIQQKTELITCDFSESLSLLLHYPLPAKISNPTFRSEYISDLYKDALKLYERKDNDLKLYEYGIKLNNKYNPNLKITMTYTGSVRNSKDSTSSMDHSPSPTPDKSEKLKFEKLRLEMRLKKKAQQLMNK